MNLYPDRIAELHDFLASRYSQRDTQATEILLASQLPEYVTRVHKPWIVLETDYPSRDTTDAWFSFGAQDQHERVKCLSVPRVQRHDPAKSILEGWISERTRPDHGLLFVEPEWRRLSAGKGSSWPLDSTYKILISMCVRLRVDHPRGTLGLKLDKTADRTELARLTRRIYQDREQHPARKPSVLAPLANSGQEAETLAVPASYLYWCEMLQRLAPRQWDWEALTGQIAGIAHGISYLYNDQRPPAWEAAERIIRDTIPWLTYWIMDRVASATYGVYYRDRLFSRRHEPETGAWEEARRLHEEKVFTLTRWKYRIGHPDWKDLIDREKRILV